MGDQKMAIVAKSNEIRGLLKETEAIMREYSNLTKSSDDGSLFDKGECIANSILAIRHLEDARMRLGKVIQYAETGVSNFDKK